MTISLENRVAIITGAGAGLGRSYAIALAERGAKVLANDLGAALGGTGSDPSRADAVVEQIIAAGGEAVADYSSVATADGGEAIVRHALDAFGSLDILVNNAGSMQLSSFAKLDVRTIGQMLDVHLGGAFYVTKPAWLAMAEQRRGRIVLTGSGIGAFGHYGAGLYGAAKGGITGLLNVLELEAQRHGIRINGVAPMAKTRMSPEELYSAVPDSSVGPELVAAVVAYLCSDECALNGEMLSVGAGSVARLFTGRTDGYFKHPELEGALTPEDVADHTDEILNTTAYSEPPTWLDEWRLVVERYGRSES